MDEQQHFYVLLPSNASSDVFPENTLTSFTVHLPEFVRLNGEYEVALQSIIWPRTFYNVGSHFDNRLFYDVGKGTWAVLSINAGFYKTMQDLIQSINKSLKAKVEIGDNIQLSFDSLSEKVFVSLKNNYRFGFTEDVSQILGFGRTPDIILDKSQQSPHVCDLNGGVHCLYIYSDIVGYQLVGDSKSRLLKVIPVEGEQGNTVFKSFNHLTYVPVETKEFDQISIDIRDVAGRKIQFQRGRVIVNLHFRARQLPL